MDLRRSGPGGAVALLCAWLFAHASIQAQEPAVCDGIEIVFFDLGDTLVELGPGDLFVVREGAAETVEALRLLGIRLGIITNVPPDWDRSDLEAILAEPAFLDQFEVVILSSEAPAPKPSPLIYEFAYAALGEAPPITQAAFVTETLDHIADSEVAPTEGARAVGMVGVHLSTAAPDPRTDFTVAPDMLVAIVEIVLESEPSVFCDGFESGTVFEWTSASDRPVVGVSAPK